MSIDERITTIESVMFTRNGNKGLAERVEALEVLHNKCMSEGHPMMNKGTMVADKRYSQIMLFVMCIISAGGLIIGILNLVM